MGPGLFLLGLLIAHVAAPDATSRHVVAGDGTAVAVADAVTVPDGPPGGHGDDHRPRHTVAECALGQPPQGPDVDVPCLSPLAPQGRNGALAPARARAAAGRDFVVPIAHAAESTVLRI